MESLLSWPTTDAAEYTRTDIVRWWEARRLRFNLSIGGVGVVTWLLVMIAGSAAVKPGEDFEEPLAMILSPFAYAFLANVCYTFGWIADAGSSRSHPRVGLYKAGCGFFRSSHCIAWCVGCSRVADDANHRTQTGLITVEKSRLRSLTRILARNGASLCQRLFTSVICEFAFSHIKSCFGDSRQ